VAHAHQHGVIHRDLKPANILLGKSGVKVLDFGLAKLERADGNSLTAGGGIIGTLRYMAPEQLTGGVAGARADISAFGAVLYELITGRPAFEGAARESPPKCPGIPPALQHLLDGCLAIDPDRR